MYVTFRSVHVFRKTLEKVWTEGSPSTPHRHSKSELAALALVTILEHLIAVQKNQLSHSLNRSVRQHHE